MLTDYIINMNFLDVVSLHSYASQIC